MFVWIKSLFVVRGISCMIGGFGIIAAVGETVARPVNLAQASQSRLGETIRDSPRRDNQGFAQTPFTREVAQATRSKF